MKKSEKTQITKEKIINAAMIGFGENGYGNASLNRIYKDNFNLYMQKRYAFFATMRGELISRSGMRITQDLIFLYQRRNKLLLIFFLAIF